MPVQRFRTRTVEIDAVRYVGTNLQEIRVWTFDTENERALFRERDRFTHQDTNDFPVEVFDTLHQTWIKVAEGQWIVRGAKGEFYPCDDETFHWKYEEITEPDFTFSGSLEYRNGVVTSTGFGVDKPENFSDSGETIERYEG